VITFETEVRIGRPIEEVYCYVSDPLNFPRWNSAVQTVRKTLAGESGVARVPSPSYRNSPGARSRRASMTTSRP
jgi:uncharacterized protein YndB with AHSA1/START domain